MKITPSGYLIMSLDKETSEPKVRQPVIINRYVVDSIIIK